MRPSCYNVPLEDEWGRLSRILDEKVDLEFNQLIQKALGEQLGEVDAVQALTEARVVLTQRLALLLALIGIASAAFSLRWLVRDLQEPATRLIRGAEAFAGGTSGTASMCTATASSRASHGPSTGWLSLSAVATSGAAGRRSAVRRKA